MDTELENLKKIAETIKNPAFHAGIFQEREKYLGDSFGTIAARRIPDSLGSGLYLTSNVQDVIEWFLYKQKEYGENFHLYVFDLDDASNLKTFDTTEELDDYTDFLGALTRYVLWDMVFEHYTKKPFDISDKAFEEHLHVFCTRYDLSEEAVKDWAARQRERCLTLTGSQDLLKEESIATLFQREMMHIDGIDTSKTIECDSISLGSLVFDSTGMKPVYDFGSNTELAKTFYQMVHDKIIENKLSNHELSADDMEDLARWGYESLPDPPFDINEYKNQLETRKIVIENIVNVKEYSSKQIDDASETLKQNRDSIEEQAVKQTKEAQRSQP